MEAALAFDTARHDRWSGPARRPAVGVVPDSAWGGWDADVVDRGVGRRGHLRLVPTGRGITPQDRGATVRLTRTGRLVRAAVVMAVVATAFGLGAGAVRAMAAGDHRVTVQAGQTLWEVASHELPQLSTPEAVARIQLANGLSSAEIHAGQELQIP